jgi:hypothetical protein
MIEIFWLNIVLIALATGERLFSVRGLIALMGAATLVPLWNCGFEIRQENIVLSLILLAWCAAQKPLKRFQTSSVQTSTQLKLGVNEKTLARFFLPAAIVIMFVVLFCQRSDAGSSFALAKLPRQMPLLLGVAIAAIAVAGREWTPNGVAAWVGKFPEVLFLIAAGIALAIHPSRLALMILVTFAFIASFRYLATVWRDVGGMSLASVGLSLVVFAHLTPFSIFTLPHLGHTNGRQEGLMRLGESLTDPAHETLLDGAGLVATRRNAPFEKLMVPGACKDFLMKHRTPVFIRGLRTDRLPREDEMFIRSSYVAVADDFWVLGKVLPPGGGTFELIHPGRYRVSSMEGSDLAGTYPEGFQGLITPEVEGVIRGTLDGKKLSILSARCLELEAGVHRLECGSNIQAVLVWMGPQLERIHRLNTGDHQRLFAESY